LSAFVGGANSFFPPAAMKQKFVEPTAAMIGASLLRIGGLRSRLLALLRRGQTNGGPQKTY